jgi:hypothetical protein
MAVQSLLSPGEKIQVFLVVSQRVIDSRCIMSFFHWSVDRLGTEDPCAKSDPCALPQVQEGSGASPAGPEEASEEVGLFDIVAVYFLEGAADREEHKWYLGRIQKMYKQFPRGRKVDYVLPVGYLTLPTLIVSGEITTTL